MYTVCVPVLDFSTGYSTFHRSFCYSARHLCDEAWVYRFRDEVFRTEGKVVYMVGRVNNIGYRLFCQIGDSVYGRNFHFFIDGFGMSVQCTTEDIRKADYIIYLVRIVGTSGCHQYIGAGCHSVFVGNFRSRVGQRKYDRHGGHATYHILTQHVSF